MAKLIRCKLQLNSIQPGGKVHFFAQYNGDDKADKEYADTVPWGQITLQINDPKIIEKLEVSRYYFIDIEVVPARKANAKKSSVAVREN